MGWSSTIVHLRIALRKDAAFPPFHPDDVTLLFADVDRPVGLIINHNDPTECFVLFQSDKYITDVFKLAGTTEWMGNHVDIKLGRPKTERVLIIEKFLEDEALEEGEGYEYIPIYTIECATSTSFHSQEG